MSVIAPVRQVYVVYASVHMELFAFALEDWGRRIFLLISIKRNFAHSM